MKIQCLGISNLTLWKGLVGCSGEKQPEYGRHMHGSQACLWTSDMLNIHPGSLPMDKSFYSRPVSILLFVPTLLFLLAFILLSSITP